MSSMLGCVAAVIAIVSPSQLRPPVIHKISISGMGAEFWFEGPLGSMRKRDSFQYGPYVPHRKSNDHIRLSIGRRQGPDLAAKREPPLGAFRPTADKKC
jgi:hypothetical protein